jgi:hypothetical protein
MEWLSSSMMEMMEAQIKMMGGLVQGFAGGMNTPQGQSAYSMQGFEAANASSQRVSSAISSRIKAAMVSCSAGLHFRSWSIPNPVFRSIWDCKTKVLLPI